MIKDYSLAIYDYQGNKLCDLSNYNISTKGEVYDISYRLTVNGYKELNFTVPAKIRDDNGNLIDNFRLDFIKNEYKVKLSIGDTEDEFIIKQVVKNRDDNGIITYDVQCVDSTFERLTKSGLDLVFDEEKGDAKTLLGKVLKNSDWSIGEVDEFLEDGKVKIRTLKGEKSNRYSFVQEICDLFKCYANFNIDTKTVDLKGDIGLDRGVEFKYSKNLKNITQNVESNEVITKLWVEGGDDSEEGLTLIEPINPTGENYIFNFDYYIDLGLISSEQLSAIDKFELEVTEINRQIKGLLKIISELSADKEIKENEREGKDVERIAKEQKIEELNQEITIEKDATKKQELINQKNTLQSEIDSLTSSINDLNTTIQNLQNQMTIKENELNTYLNSKDTAIKELEIASGDLIKEGLYQNDNYTDSFALYQDALSISKSLSYPRVSYDCNVLDLSRLTGFELESFGLGDKVYIIDETLNINTNGRIAEIDYILDNPVGTSVKISNYDTKLEDMFKKIIVASNTINSRKEIYDRAQGINADGTLNYDLLQKTFDSNTFQVKFGTNNKVIQDNYGITIKDIIDENKMVRINSGGIFITSDGGNTWKYALSADGISALNITSGLLDTKQLQIWNSSEPRFYWDDGGLFAYGYSNSQWIRFNKDGIYFTRDNGATYDLVMNWSGLMIGNKTAEEINNSLDRYDDGELKGLTYTFNGSGFVIGGGTLDVAEHTNTKSKYKHLDGSYTQISASGLKRYVGDSDYTYHYLTYVGEVEIEINKLWTGSVTLDAPDEFRGKNFKVSPALIGWDVPYSHIPIKINVWGEKVKLLNKIKIEAMLSTHKLKKTFGFIDGTKLDEKIGGFWLEDSNEYFTNVGKVVVQYTLLA